MHPRVYSIKNLSSRVQSDAQSTEILSEGVEILLQYCRVREKRFDKFKELMSEFQFDYSEAHMAPEAFGVLTGRTGFLTPEI